eukprot:TRINITY_DN1206_c0_g1_i1.p1 TRINITY_DN1206_c0_g1~~TRINITY_DN1206_c0_g1_i1.p1  ORF type:complete len:257 (+),score=58.74 TRINITY_DN1206_c0_g1_i1:156-926(+)
MASPQMWTSKLGNKYPMAKIQEDDMATQAELKRLRGLKAENNHLCADCGSPDNSWASVTHGVFVCIVCSDVHRSVGTHISKMKGCSGTYLWGPDELKVMQEMGNRRYDQFCGGKKVSPHVSKDEKQRYVVAKYQDRQLTRSDLRASEVGMQGFKTAPQEPLRVADRASLAEKPTRAEQPVTITPRTVVSTQHGRPLARKADIPDDFFDSIFGMDESPKHSSSAAQTVVPPKQSNIFMGFDFDDLLGDASPTVAVAA